MKLCAPDCGNGCCVLHFNEALKLGHEAWCLPEAVFARAPRGLDQSLNIVIPPESHSIICSEMPSSGSPWPGTPRAKPRSGRQCVRAGISSVRKNYDA